MKKQQNGFSTWLLTKWFKTHPPRLKKTGKKQKWKNTKEQGEKYKDKDSLQEDKAEDKYRSRKEGKKIKTFLGDLVSNPEVLAWKLTELEKLKRKKLQETLDNSNAGKPLVRRELAYPSCILTKAWFQNKLFWKSTHCWYLKYSGWIKRTSWETAISHMTTTGTHLNI